MAEECHEMLLDELILARTEREKCIENVDNVGIWVEQIVPHRLDMGMVLGL